MELLFTGGRVLTIDAMDRIASGVAVRDGRIVAVGDSADVHNAVGPDATHVDLRGRALVPGFCDPHNHFSMTTFEPRSVDCRRPPLASKSAVLDAIAAAASGSPAGQWIWGLGFSQSEPGIVTDDMLFRDELDEVAPNNPVCVMDSSYHACYANSAALAMVGIDRDTPDPRGGNILHDDSGEPNGVLWERAMDPVHHATMRSYIDTFGPDVVAGLVEQNALRHLSHGITSVGDALVMPESAEIYRLTDERGRLPIAIHQMRGGPGFFAAPEDAAAGAYMDDDVSDRLRGGIVKIFMDPVWPSPAMELCHPDGTTEPVGEPYYGQEEVDHLVLDAASHGLQVAIHCIGNRAVEQGLNEFERALRETPGDDRRFRIEHFMFATSEQIERAQSLGVMISHQPPFLHLLGDYFEQATAQPGIDAVPMPYRSMLDAGVHVASGSDFPCAPVPPLLGLYGLTTRTSRDGTVIAADEAIHPLEALRTYTLNSAAAMFRDHEVGSVEVGKRADLAVLSHDPTLVDSTYIREIVVQQTYVDGELLYSV
ncbi:MAG: amidohydrolase [Chloroflexota bacterium]|nr:amidohydrolase [Chloroflexota bacterium]